MWASTHRASGATVAVRVLDEPAAASPRVVFAFQKEVRAAIALDHAAIAAPFAHGLVTPEDAEVYPQLPVGVPWSAMEWLDGGPASPGPIPWPRLKAILLQALAALAHIHARGGDHGAIRTSNLLWTGSGDELRLTDAGMDRVRVALHDITDPRPAVSTQRVDLAMLGRVTTGWLADHAPEGFARWTARLRGSRGALPFDHAADAAFALGALDGAPGGRLPPVPEDWRPLGPRAAARWPPGLFPVGHGSRPIPMVGRIAERDQLWATVHRARQEGRVLGAALRGPPGVGKATLADWLAVRTQELGLHTVLRAWHAPAWGPGQGLAPMVRRFLGCDGLPATLARRRADRAMAELGVEDFTTRAAIADWLAPETAVDRPTGPLIRYELLSALLRCVAARRPVLLWIEDAQWGLDALAFVDHLLARSPDFPAVVVLSLRPDRLSRRAGESALLDRLMARPEWGTIDLGPLGAREERALLESLGLDRGLIAQAASVARGNPLFAVALVRELAERQVLVEAEGGRRRLRHGAPPLPNSLEAVWLSRLGRVLGPRSKDEVDAVELGAILGGVVDPGDWFEVCRPLGANPDDALVAQLMGAGLAIPCEDGGPDSWRFVHGSVVRAAVRRSRRRGRALTLHRGCAGVLTERVARTGRSIHYTTHARLVRHLVGAGDVDELTTPLFRAIRERVQAGEPWPAAELLSVAAPVLDKLADRPEDHRRGARWVFQAQVHDLQGHTAGMVTLATRAEAAARRYRWRTILVQALNLRARGAFRRGDAALGLQWLHDAEAVATRLGDPWLKAITTREIGRLSLAIGALDEATACLQEAHHAHQFLDDGNGLGECLRVESRMALALGRLDVAVSLADTAHATSLEAGNRWGAAEASVLRADLYRHQGDLDGAHSRYQRAAAWHRSLGTQSAWAPHLGMALVDLEAERWRRGINRLDALTDHEVEAGHPALRVLRPLAMALASGALRRPGAMTRYLTEARETTSETAVVDPDIIRLAQRLGARVAESEPVAAHQARELARTQLRGLGRDDEADQIEADGGPG